MDTGRKPIGPRDRKIIVVPGPTPHIHIIIRRHRSDSSHIKASNGLSSQYVVRGAISALMHIVTNLVHLRIIEKDAVRASASARLDMSLRVKGDVVRTPFHSHCRS